VKTLFDCKLTAEFAREEIREICRYFTNM